MCTQKRKIPGNGRVTQSSPYRPKRPDRQRGQLIRPFLSLSICYIKTRLLVLFVYLVFVIPTASRLHVHMLYRSFIIRKQKEGGAYNPIWRSDITRASSFICKQNLVYPNARKITKLILVFCVVQYFISSTACVSVSFLFLSVY